MPGRYSQPLLYISKMCRQYRVFEPVIRIQSNPNQLAIFWDIYSIDQQFHDCIVRQPFVTAMILLCACFRLNYWNPKRQWPASEVHPLPRCWTCWADRRGGQPKPTLWSLPVMFSCPLSQRNSNHLNGKFCANRLTWNGERDIKNKWSMSMHCI